jgi:hypothetical protein
MIKSALLPAAVAAFAIAAPASAQAAIEVFNAKPLTAQAGEEIKDHRVVSFDEAGECHEDSYSVTVHWGDGTSSAGEIARADQITPERCAYQAEGSHTYAEAGTYQLTATICHGADCATTPAAALATVAPGEDRSEPQSDDTPTEAPAADTSALRTVEPVVTPRNTTALFVNQPVTRTSLRRTGLVLRAPGFTAREAIIRLTDARTGRRLHTGRAKLRSDGTLRLRVPKAVAKRLRAGRRYGVTMPRQAGLPTLQLSFRLR